jgi:hypothetical protein
MKFARLPVSFVASCLLDFLLPVPILPIQPGEKLVAVLPLRAIRGKIGSHLWKNRTCAARRPLAKRISPFRRN